MTAVDEIIERVGTRALAEALGVTTQYIYKAKRLGYFSPVRADQIESLYSVPREQLVKPALRAFISGNMAEDLI